MRSIGLILVFILIYNTLSSQTYKVLFIGNSYTASHNLPVLIADLANANGDFLYFDAVTPGGYTFQLHSNDPVTLGKIQQDSWDFVVLQEQSQLPSFPPLQVQSQVYPYAGALCDAILLNDSCTKPMFFMTWGRKYGDQQNCPSYPPVCSFQGMQQRLRDSYKEMADSNRALVAPVGVAWKMVRDIDSTIALYETDYSHPSIKGSYLTACVFYASLWQKSPVGLPYPAGITANEASLFQNISFDLVTDSLTTWNIGVFDPHADFQYAMNGSTVSFTNTSSNADAFSWSFGDGNQSNLVSPVHVYPGNGTYIVSLMANNTCMTDFHSYTLNINATSLTEPLQDRTELTLFPNPVKSGNEFFIHGKCSIQYIEIQQADGKIVYRASGSRGHHLSIPAGIVDAPGLYLLHYMQEGGKRMTQKFMVN